MKRWATRKKWIKNQTLKINAGPSKITNDVTDDVSKNETKATPSAESDDGKKQAAKAADVKKPGGRINNKKLKGKKKEKKNVDVAAKPDVRSLLISEIILYFSELEIAPPEIMPLSAARSRIRAMGDDVEEIEWNRNPEL